MLRRVLAYSHKIFRLPEQLGDLPDHRQKPEIPAAAFSKAILILWLCRLPSLNALDQYRGRSGVRRFLRHGLPSGDEIAEVSEIMDVPALRHIQGRMYHRLSRNKVLRPLLGHRLAIVDAHEINCSYHRSCPQCQERQITVNGVKRTQYYHRVVVLLLAGEGFYFPLDLELLQPGDDEGTAALRLIERVLQNHPRSFDILLGDGLYPQARIFKLLRRHGKHALVVLKDERRDVLKDARGLFGITPSLTYKSNGVRYQCWDVEHLDSWDSYPEKVRVVRSIETTTFRERVHGKWVQRKQISEWVWVTTLPSGEVPTRTIIRFGHERWRIENECFNELVNQWHANHYFHHHPVSITAFWLLLFMAYTLFHCFLRNLKPAVRQNHSVLFWALCILGEFVHVTCPFSSA